MATAITEEQMEQAKAHVARALKALGPNASPGDRGKLRMEIFEVRSNIQTRRRELEIEIRRLDKYDASLAMPWKAMGSAGMHVALALLSQTDGRVWALRLQHGAKKMFGMARGTLWTALRLLETEGIIRVHTRPADADKHREPVPTWIEVLGVTEGAGVPPPADPHVHAWDRTQPPVSKPPVPKEPRGRAA